MSGAFTPKYSDEERAAVAHSYVPHKRSAKDVARLAAAGKLRTPDGSRVEAFEIPEASVRNLVRKHRVRVLAETKRAPVAEAEHRDAIESLRVRLVAMADEEMRLLERTKAGKRNVERARQVGRLVREAAALPARDDPRPPAPGAKVDGDRGGFGETRGGMAGKLLAAHRAATGAAPAPVAPSVEAEPQHPDPVSLDEHGQALAAEIEREMRPFVEPEPEPPAPRDRPTWASQPHEPGEVPPGSPRDDAGDLWRAESDTSLLHTRNGR